MINRTLILEAYELDLLIKKHAYKRLESRGISVHELEEAIETNHVKEAKELFHAYTESGKLDDLETKLYGGQIREFDIRVIYPVMWKQTVIVITSNLLF